MKRIVVFSGSGISAESGIKTFRASDGLWESYKIEEVATPEAWNANPAKVLDFYRLRHEQILNAKPNAAHFALAALEDAYDVQIITQNIDDLHERAGSSKVWHLHGEIMKVRSVKDAGFVKKISDQYINIGDFCPKGGQLRPHIVWFGELVPAMEQAMQLTSTADIFIVIGTSLVVYPAASLVNFAPSDIPKYLIDPEIPGSSSMSGFNFIQKNAAKGVKQLVEELLKAAN
jgi:NAD-dependent deacetylase